MPETLREKDWGAAADEIGEYDCTAIDDWRIDEMDQERRGIYPLTAWAPHMTTRQARWRS